MEYLEYGSDLRSIDDTKSKKEQEQQSKSMMSIREKEKIQERIGRVRKWLLEQTKRESNAYVKSKQITNIVANNLREQKTRRGTVRSDEQNSLAKFNHGVKPLNMKAI